MFVPAFLQFAVHDGTLLYLMKFNQEKRGFSLLKRKEEHINRVPYFSLIP